MESRFVSLREWEGCRPSTTDKISVRNLRLIVNSGYDIWGRQKPQPVAISVTVSLKDTFGTSATQDTIDASTVHYGHLSRRITELLEHQDERAWISPDELVLAVAFAVMKAASNPSIIATIETTACFTKASRFGEGVNIMLYHVPDPETNCSILHLDGMKIPALVGANSHERSMKQLLLVSVWIDRIKRHITECYVEVEQLVVKTVDESSFETLESLAEELAARLVKYFIYPKQESTQNQKSEPAGVRIRVEKPSAIISADSPSIEIYRSADPQDPFGKRMLTELGPKRPVIPFPLGGRLDEFLQSWKQD